MNIILHGATDCESSNYGDFLYGKLIFDYLKRRVPEAEVKFYNPSEYFIKYIESKSDIPLKGNIKTATVAIYIPGGYFGEGHNASWKETIVQFIRFIPFGIKAILNKKPIAIVGVGAGPNNNYIFKKAIKFVVNHADSTSVRDHESLVALNTIGCKNITSYNDLILAFDVTKYDSPEAEQHDRIEKLINKYGKKIILVHFNHSRLAAQKFGEAIKLLVKEHTDYYPVVSADQILANSQELLHVFESGYQSKDYFYYDYDNPFDFGRLVSQSDFVLTCKLHVGVTAAQKEKALLAVAVHPEKTVRFYEQINATEHFTDIETISAKEIADKITKLLDKKVIVPQTAIDLAKQHLAQLDCFISKQLRQNRYVN